MKVEHEKTRTSNPPYVLEIRFFFKYKRSFRFVIRDVFLVGKIITQKT